jgi:hypothetical protein
VRLVGASGSLLGMTGGEDGTSHWDFVCLEKGRDGKHEGGGETSASAWGISISEPFFYLEKGVPPIYQVN